MRHLVVLIIGGLVIAGVMWSTVMTNFAYSAITKASYKYKFTLEHPPLMKDLKGPPIDVPTGDLEMEIGRVSWKKSEVGMLGDEQITTYNVTRKQVWVLSDVPHHYAQDRKTKVTTTTGYSKSSRTTFERAFEAGASGTLFGFGADVKASLHLSDEIEQQWREESSVETEVAFQAAHWYASWSLLDMLLGTKIVIYKDAIGRINQLHANSEFKVIVTVYDDISADTQMRHAWSGSTTTIFLNDSKPYIWTSGPIGKYDYSPFVKEYKMFDYR
jgi:hypothetical protein